MAAIFQDPIVRDLVDLIYRSDFDIADKKKLLQGIHQTYIAYAEMNEVHKNLFTYQDICLEIINLSPLRLSAKEINIFSKRSKAESITKIFCKNLQEMAHSLYNHIRQQKCARIHFLQIVTYIKMQKETYKLWGFSGVEDAFLPLNQQLKQYATFIIHANELEKLRNEYRAIDAASKEEKSKKYSQCIFLSYQIWRFSTKLTSCASKVDSMMYLMLIKAKEFDRKWNSLA